SLRLLMLPLVAATFIGTGCQMTKGDGDRTAGRVLDDNNITAKVETALRNAANYKYNDVSVSTYRGVVQLSGWTGSDDQKETATRLAKSVPGVSDVVNNISVKEVDEKERTRQSSQAKPTETSQAKPAAER